MITREEVIWAYRYILGREPESEKTIDAAMRHESRWTLRLEMFSSDEFINSDLAQLIDTAKRQVRRSTQSGW